PPAHRTSSNGSPSPACHGTKHPTIRPTAARQHWHCTTECHSSPRQQHERPCSGAASPPPRHHRGGMAHSHKSVNTPYGHISVTLGFPIPRESIPTNRSRRSAMVELMGIEPLTSAMQKQRSTN